MKEKQRKKYCVAAGICWISLLTTVQADITTGLTAYWKFDETSGVTAADSSGRGNQATLINFQENDSMWVTGRIGGALQFNLPESGDDDQVVTDNPIVLDNQDSFTFAFWARRQPGDNPFNPRFITPVSNQHWVLWTPGTGVGFYVPARTADPPVGAWRHYVVLYDRGAGRYSVYVDGQKVVNNVAAARPEPGETQWVIGHKELLEDHRDPWRGFLDDLRMYNRVLSDSDVQELYSQAAATAPRIVTQPQPASKFVGDTFSLSVVVEGTAPFSYQWRKGGTPIPSATNSSLLFDSLQLSDSGIYSVAITNAVGGLVSAEANLQVTDPPVDINLGLVLLYNFDETHGVTVSDSSGHGHHGTVVNSLGDGSEWVAGRLGGGLLLNPPDTGNDDYVLTDAGITFTNQDNFTFSFWAKAAAGQGVNPRIITPTSAHWVLWTPGTGVGFFTPAPSPEPIEGVWRHFAVTFDRAAGSYQVFANGQRSTGEITGRSRTAPNDAQWIIGHSENPEIAADNYNGVLDDVRIYNRILTAKEIAAIYALAPAEAPSIVQPPKSMIAAAGDQVTLSVVAGGTVTAYQWKKGTNLVAGATGDKLTLTNVTPADAGEYSVTVKNSMTETNSAPARLTIIPVLDLRNAPATSDADFSTNYAASKAFDGLRQSTGEDGSRWASPGDSSPHSLTVDLGEPIALRYVLLDWEAAYGVDFTLRGSTVAEGPWTDLATVTGYAQAGHGLDGPDVVFDFASNQVVLQSSTAEAPATTIVATDAPVRYLMLEGQTATLGLFSVWELQVSAEGGSTNAPPSLSVTRNEQGITISWPAEITDFTLESTDALPASTWTPTPGVTNNSVTVQPTGRRFYRLREQ